MKKKQKDNLIEEMMKEKILQEKLLARFPSKIDFDDYVIYPENQDSDIQLAKQNIRQIILNTLVASIHLRILRFCWFTFKLCANVMNIFGLDIYAQIWLMSLAFSDFISLLCVFIDKPKSLLLPKDMKNPQETKENRFSNITQLINEIETWENQFYRSVAQSPINVNHDQIKKMNTLAYYILIVNGIFLYANVTIIQFYVFTGIISGIAQLQFIILMKYKPSWLLQMCQFIHVQKHVVNLNELNQQTYFSENKYKCMICQQQFFNIDPIICLPCDKTHIFHKDCMKMWINIYYECPICLLRIEQNIQMQQFS
ncbi:hypothetical protein pb186bvf_020848 [Paramecium bursaria]